MAKDHGPSVKDDKQYEGLRKKGMSKQRAAKIANTKGASKSDNALLRFDREPGPSEMKSSVPSITWATISRAAPSWLDGKTLIL